MFNQEKLSKLINLGQTPGNGEQKNVSHKSTWNANYTISILLV